ncbi:aminomethyltransferase family protein [bacterium]|nr:aminomethyltransferase family protein [bacterium]MBU1753926.1 aminomethyltransferase family protein [bacterium]
MSKNILYNHHIDSETNLKICGEGEMHGESTGSKEEYQAVRERIGLFDLSCITMIKITGENSLEFLEELCTGNVSAMSEGKIINTLLCNEDGKIIAIIWLLRDEECFFIHSDAEKKKVIWDWLNQHSKKYQEGKVKLEDLCESFKCLSVIGTKAIEIPKRLVSEDTIGLPYLGFEHGKIEDEIDCLLCRYGYTGEYEYRFIIPHESLEKAWHKIEETGKEEGIIRCGLGVLDILMLEMKSVNQNRDILEDTTPLQAGLHWMIYFRKEAFVGKEAIFEEKEKGVSSKLITITLEDGKPLKENSQIFLDSEKIGFIIHSGYSPTLKKEIGLAYIESAYAWVGLEFEAETIIDEKRKLKTVSAPLFITKTVIAAQEG